MEPTSAASIRQHMLGIKPMEPGDSPQSLRHLKRMLSNDAYRTVHTCQLRMEGQPEELELDAVKKNAEYVISEINKGTYIRRRRNPRRTVGIPVPAHVMYPVFDVPEGVVECYGNLPTTIGQVSRFSMAWWTNADNRKYIRFFGDRIHLNFAQPSVPRLSPFGQNPYFIVFETNDPHHCLMCRKDLKIGEGIWIDKSFYCADCQYERDTGLRPGINKLRKKKAR